MCRDPAHFKKGTSICLLETALGERRAESCGGIFLVPKRSEKFYSIIVQRRPLKTFVSKRRDKYFRDVLLLSHEPGPIKGILYFRVQLEYKACPLGFKHLDLMFTCRFNLKIDSKTV